MTSADDQELQRVEQHLAAAAHALGEFEHVSASRVHLANDLAAAEGRIHQLRAELARERDDVARLTAGVRGFLYALLGDAQLSTEQREAMEAEARLAEADAYWQQLRGRLSAVEAQLAPYAGQDLVGAAAAARAAKEELLIRLNHPAGIALQDLAVRIESIDIELIPLDSAVSAGELALQKVQHVVSTLERARDERLEQADARGTAGQAEAAIAVFHRAVDALGTAEEATWGFATLVGPEERAPFVDTWIRALVGKGDRNARLTAASATMTERLVRLEAQLTRVRARRDELAPRRAALLSERHQLLARRV